MPVEPIHSTNLGVDMTPRLVPPTTTVVASPSAATETIIAQLTIPNFGNIAVVNGVLLQGWCAYTLGTSASACTVKIRQTNVSGTTIATTGAMTGGHNSAGLLVADDVNGYDAGAGASVYVLTLTVTGGAAASTVSAVLLSATIL